MKKWIAAFVCLLVSASVISAAVIVANAETVMETLGSLTITGDDINNGNDYEYEYVDSEYGYILTIKSDKQMTISGNTTVDRIVVNSPNGANLIFSDLSVNTSTRGDLAAFDIDASITNKDAVIKVTLKNGTDNTLKSQWRAGLQKSSDDCTLIIEGDGKLAAMGGEHSAGIGGGPNGNGTNIIINGGDITATSGTGGAGIGGGENGNGSNIQIYGGTIVATTLSDGGAGIGGGNGGKGEKIYIFDCTSITANGSSGGAGIGGGLNGDCDDIQIQKGTQIKATGSGDSTGYGGGAGIGGGSNGSGTNITISGGLVEANAGSGGAGIGGGSDIKNSGSGNGSGIEISGDAKVTAFGGNGGAGIGGGGFGSGTNITISGNAHIEASNYGNGAGIGGGRGAAGANITISGNAYVEATSVSYGAGIGGGYQGNGSGITISSSDKIIAKGGFDGAGIGGGYQGSGTNITISGGFIEATGVDGGAGIGGGSGGSGDDITIKGSAKVTATGGYRGAGIGGGYRGDGSNITIGDDSDSAADIANRVVIAKSEGAFEGQNGNGAGIGGGGAGNGEDIIINSGNVTATSDLGAGIGGGGVTEADASNRGGDGKNITINGGKITATSNGGGAGIGGGQQGGKGTDITIKDGTVIATSEGDTDKGGNGIGAGIGGGSSNTTYNFKGNGENIIINGGIVTATGTGAGIGGGGGGDGIGITISGNTVVTATGATKAGFGGSAGIGGGNGGDGTDITISGSAKVTATSLQNGADIGGGSSGVGTNITISENADVTVNYNGCFVCIGSCINNDTTSKIEITGGTVTAADTTVDPPAKNENITASWGIGSMGPADITISGNAKINVAANMVAIGSGGKGSVTINGGNVTATGNQFSGINCNNITISGDNTQVTAECKNSNGVGIGSFMSSADCTVTITGGTVTANGGTAGIGGAGSTVYIQGTSSTSYPWVFTNKITSVNGDGDYFGIVFDENHKKDYVADTPVAGEESCNSDNPKKVYGADGVVYGNGREDGLVVLNKEYTLESGKVLRVQDGATFKIPETGEGKDSMLTLEASSILYIEKGADLDKYDKITYEGEGNDKGKVLHEAKSVYVNKLCTLCGSETGHTWKTDWVCNKTYHWHECEKNTDCSIHEYKIDLCSITENEDKDGYGEHSFVKTRNNNIVTFTCNDCGYSYRVVFPEISIYKVDSDDEPLPGAKFSLYSNADCTEQVGEEVTATDRTVNGETKAIAVFTADIELDTLYYIKETKAPDGYKKSNKVYTVKVTAETGESDEPMELPVEAQTINGKAAYGAVGSTDTSEEIPVCENYAVEVVSDPVKIIKVDGETRTPLTGARFGIYSDEGCSELITAGTTAMDTDNASNTYNKAAVSFDTEPGTTYYIKEITPPDGYTASEEVYKAVVDADGKVTYSVVGSTATSEEIPVCENYAVEVVSDPIKIIKVDGETNSPLAGAQFSVYSDAACQNPITSMTGTTAMDTDNASATYNKAVVSFSTEPDRTYYIKETKAPDGYTASDKVFKAVVGADGKVTYGTVDSVATSETVPVCENYAVKVIVSDPAKIIKVDGETGAPLAGAQFGIYSDAERTKLIKTVTAEIDTDNTSATYNKAVASFSTEPNSTYYIKETFAPDGYRVSDEVFKAVVDADGKVTYGTVGSETTSADIPVCENYTVKVIVSAPAKIIKVDSETGAPLAGAQFGIYSDAECTKLITTGITVIDTDNASATYNQAAVSFSTEPNKTYFIKETNAPDGYRVSHEVFKAVVDADGKVTYAAAGSATTSETVPICKNEKTDEDDDISDLEPDPEDTPPAKAVSPKTGDTSGSGIVEMAILSGITCAISFVGLVQKRKKKQWYS